MEKEISNQEQNVVSAQAAKKTYPDIDYENDVRLVGYIVHVFRTEKMISLSVSCRRPNQSKPEDGAQYKRDVVKVLFFGEKAEEVYQNFHEGDRVTVTANVQSSRKRERGNMSIQGIFGETIKHTQRRLESSTGIQGGHTFPLDQNEVVICGELISVKSFSKRTLNCIIRTLKNNHVSYVHATYFTSDPGSLLATFHPGDVVGGIGDIESTKKTLSDGTIKHYEDVVLTEIGRK